MSKIAGPWLVMLNQRAGGTGESKWNMESLQKNQRKWKWNKESLKKLLKEVKVKYRKCSKNQRKWKWNKESLKIDFNGSESEI